MALIRETAFVVRCSYCETAREVDCIRCNRPLCSAHGPTGNDQRCPQCEALHQQETSLIIPPSSTSSALKSVSKKALVIGLVSGAVATAFLSVFGIIGLIQGTETVIGVAGALVGIFLLMTIWVGLLVAVGGSPLVVWRGISNFVRHLRLFQSRRRFLGERPGDRAAPKSLVGVSSDWLGNEDKDVDESVNEKSEP